MGFIGLAADETTQIIGLIENVNKLTEFFCLEN